MNNERGGLGFGRELEAGSWELYDRQLAAELGEPVSGREASLWRDIERADRPIRGIAKRINRLLARDLPEEEIMTIDSCSGHTGPDGNLLVIDRGGGYKEEMCPHFIFFKPLQWTTEQIGYLRSIFSPAVETVQKDYGSMSIVERAVEPMHVFHGSGYNASGEWTGRLRGDSLSLKYEIRPAGQGQAGKMLSEFWRAVENHLSELDGIQIKSGLKPSDFVRENRE